MAAPAYLLDTNIVLALIRNSPLGQYIDAAYRLLHQPIAPLVCIVCHGEMRSLAAQFGWGRGRVQAMEKVLSYLRVADIHDPAVIQAYVDIDAACLAHPGGARNIGQNDLWIAATAKATGATLLTTDRDFDHLHPAQLQRIYVDPASRLPGAPGSPP